MLLKFEIQMLRKILYKFPVDIFYSIKVEKLMKNLVMNFQILDLKIYTFINF